MFFWLVLLYGFCGLSPVWADCSFLFQAAELKSRFFFWLNPVDSPRTGLDPALVTDIKSVLDLKKPHLNLENSLIFEARLGYELKYQWSNNQRIFRKDAKKADLNQASRQIVEFLEGNGLVVLAEISQPSNSRDFTKGYELYRFRVQLSDEPKVFLFQLGQLLEKIENDNSFSYSLSKALD